MPTLAFEKYEGLGNDFLVVRADAPDVVDAAGAVRLCDRHFGVGGDGVLLVVPASGDARARMIVLNADGSRPEMCGNGVRCVALALSREDGSQRGELVLETDAGERHCAFERDGDRASVSVGMGRGLDQGPIEVELDGERLSFHRISMGNPHAIAFEADLDEATVDRYGPIVSGAVRGGSNVEFVRDIERGRSVVVWERGVGRTLACGTGACAVGVAAALAGRADFDAPQTVILPGGPLDITVASETLEVTMRGPARRVFSGSIELNGLA